MKNDSRPAAAAAPEVPLGEKNRRQLRRRLFLPIFPIFYRWDFIDYLQTSHSSGKGWVL